MGQFDKKIKNDDDYGVDDDDDDDDDDDYGLDDDDEDEEDDLVCIVALAVDISVLLHSASMKSS